MAASLLQAEGIKRRMGEGRTVPSAIALTYTMLYWASAQNCTFLEMLGIAVMPEEVG